VCFQIAYSSHKLINLTRDKENIYRKAPWQPSLAAGGPVDLLDTFTPTPYGTFSFGGKSKRTSGTAKSTPKPLAPHPKTSLPKSPTTAGTMAPLDSSTEGNFLPLTAAPLAPENIPAPEQVDRANDSGGALAVPHSGGVSDEYVPAVPLAVRSTNTHPAPPTQHDEEGEAIAHGTSAQAEADPLGAALEGLDYPRPNEQCNGGVNGAVHGLANGTVGPGEPLFARRRAGTGVCISRVSLSSISRKLLYIQVPSIQMSSDFSHIQIRCTDSAIVQGSNPMAESSLIGAAKVPIHPDSWLRREIATPAPLMDDTNPGPPSSISSYSRRLSEASREEIEKVRELQ
jgi:hypothetical protein